MYSDMSDTLSSDVLERQFGATVLEILKQEGLSRLIRAKVAATGQVLEVSRVAFRPEGIAAFPDVHKKIVAGASMGKAFTAAGIPFKRQVWTTYRADKSALPYSFSEHFTSPGQHTVIEVSVVAGPEQTAYADILEVYSPEVSWQPAAPDRPA